MKKLNLLKFALFAAVVSMLFLNQSCTKDKTVNFNSKHIVGSWDVESWLENGKSQLLYSDTSTGGTFVCGSSDVYRNGTTAYVLSFREEGEMSLTSKSNYTETNVFHNDFGVTCPPTTEQKQFVDVMHGKWNLIHGGEQLVVDFPGLGGAIIYDLSMEKREMDLSSTSGSDVSKLSLTKN